MIAQVLKGHGTQREREIHKGSEIVSSGRRRPIPNDKVIGLVYWKTVAIANNILKIVKHDNL